MKISGSLIQAYIICPRQAWLMSHQITGNQYNEFLVIGRLYSEETYKREKKEILIDGNKIDVIKEKNGVLTLIETKKSSKMINAAKMQLLNYLYSFSKKGFSVKGEIRVPKEKKIIKIDLSKENVELLKKTLNDIEMLIKKEIAPEPVRKNLCKTCSYNEFCWS